MLAKDFFVYFYESSEFADIADMYFLFCKKFKLMQNDLRKQNNFSVLQ